MDMNKYIIEPANTRGGYYFMSEMRVSKRRSRHYCDNSIHIGFRFILKRKTDE